MWCQYHKCWNVITPTNWYFEAKCPVPNCSTHHYLRLGKDGRFYTLNLESARDKWARENIRIADRHSKITTRVRMPDGTILSGQAGLRELDARRRFRETGSRRTLQF